jgi:hypothetical protein
MTQEQTTQLQNIAEFQQMIADALAILADANAVTWRNTYADESAALLESAACEAKALAQTIQTIITAA